jgi:hypothetical protein
MKKLSIFLCASLAAASAQAACFEEFRCRSADGKVELLLESDMGDMYSARVEVKVDGRNYALPTTRDDENGEPVHARYSLVPNFDVPGYALYTVFDRESFEPIDVLSLAVKKEAIAWSKERMKGGVSEQTGKMSGMLTLHHYDNELFPDRKVTVSCKMVRGCD